MTIKEFQKVLVISNAVSEVSNIAYYRCCDLYRRVKEKQNEEELQRLDRDFNDLRRITAKKEEMLHEIVFDAIEGEK